MWNRVWTDYIQLTQEGFAWLTSSLPVHEQIQKRKTSSRWQVKKTNIQLPTDMTCKGNCTAQVAKDCVKFIQCFHCASILHELRHFLQNSSNCWINCCILFFFIYFLFIFIHSATNVTLNIPFTSYITSLTYKHY